MADSRCEGSRVSRGTAGPASIAFPFSSEIRILTGVTIILGEGSNDKWICGNCTILLP